MAKSRRKENTRQIPPDLILIVCEGEKTEPSYFECFPLHTTKIAIIKGTGTSTMTLINETEKELQKAKDWYFTEYGNRVRDKDIVVWCVFDKDNSPNHQFDNAIHSARAKKYRVAYSNEAFELWYWLHFDYVNTAVNRNEYKSRLSKRLGFEYQKNNPKMYQILKNRQQIALQNAKKLYQSYSPSIPSKDNPSTTMFEIVEYLNQFGKNE